MVAVAPLCDWCARQKLHTNPSTTAHQMRMVRPRTTNHDRSMTIPLSLQPPSFPCTPPRFLAIINCMARPLCKEMPFCNRTRPLARKRSALRRVMVFCPSSTERGERITRRYLDYQPLFQAAEELVCSTYNRRHASPSSSGTPCPEGGPRWPRGPRHRSL